MSVLHRGSASLSPQDRDADELPLTHQIRWTLLASSQEHKMNQSAFFKQKSPAKRNSRNKQSSGESWAWRLSRNIIKWIRKANRELEGERGRNLCINLPCHCGVCPLSGTWITVLLSSKAMIKPPFMHWCRVWPCMAIYDFKCTGQLVLPVSVRQEISPGPLWVETEKQRSEFLQVTKYILGRAGRGSENCRMQKSQFWAQPMNRSQFLMAAANHADRGFWDRLSLCPGSSSHRLRALIHLVVGEQFQGHDETHKQGQLPSDYEKGQ